MMVAWPQQQHQHQQYQQRHQQTTISSTTPMKNANTSSENNNQFTKLKSSSRSKSIFSSFSSRSSLSITHSLTYSFPLHYITLHYINNTTSTKGYQQVTYTVSYSHLRKRNCPTLTVCLPCSFVHFILSLSKRNAKRNHEWVSELVSEW